MTRNIFAEKTLLAVALARAERIDPTDPESMEAIHKLVRLCFSLPSIREAERRVQARASGFCATAEQCAARITVISMLHALDAADAVEVSHAAE
jgi:ATP phosphoribosyltransferase regulatory subunit HisZ